MNYKKAGVDIERGDEASSILYEASKKTFANRTGLIGDVILPFDDFTGIRAVDISKLPAGSFMSMNFDGVGTKVEIAQRMGRHDTIAYDLIAMVADDAIVRGAEPVLVGSVLDVSSIDVEGIKELASGYVKAAKAANVAVVNGELAELGDAVGGYGDFKYNWCASLVWFARKEKLFTGDELEIGDSIVVLREKGFRSNGLSLVRKVFEVAYGSDWHNHQYKGTTLGDRVLQPSKIYSKAFISMHGGFSSEGSCKIHGVAHITGGGIPGKLGRILKKRKYGAYLEDLYSPCKGMLHCQEIGDIEDREAYRTWNMGNGLMVVTPEPEKVVNEVKRFDIEAKVAGEVSEDHNIKIKSKGFFGGELNFSLE